MITLRARARASRLDGPLSQRVWAVEESNLGAPEDLPRLIARSVSWPHSEAPILLQRYDDPSAESLPRVIRLPRELGYLSAGDAVALSPDGWSLQTLWRHESFQNFLLLTERCDNYCLMCSQPPKEQQDDYLLDQAFDVVGWLPTDTSAFTLTGGEPTLHGERLLELLTLSRERLPHAQVQLLTNGRKFSDPQFASEYAAAVGVGTIACIPLYAPEPERHDFVVQARGAFDETVRGILNLARLDQRVEIRVVLHRQTIPVLEDLAEFIARNLPFVERVALMGLEVTGLARVNLDKLWIDPFDYGSTLAESVDVLDSAGIPTLIYNHQLCVLPIQLRSFAVQSISDWKNDYLPVCDGCTLRASCGGFFFSPGYRHSEHIRAVGVN